jgi:hypothetical protein
MYYNEHNPPHFHAEYNGMEALFDIVNGVFMKGALPTTQSRYILAWYEFHKQELLDMWNTKSFGKIKPLKK